MPTYDYKCESCGHEFEVFQGISKRPIRKCPKCGKLKLKRLIGSGSGVIFKGDDWPGQEIVRGREKQRDSIGENSGKRNTS